MPDTKTIDQHNIPEHIAIIMDGNGRWAQERGLPRTMGHKAGVETVQRIVKTAQETGIKVLTLYAFSTENWKRPPLEVQTLMSLLKSYLSSELKTLVSNNVSLRCIGQIEQMPNDVQDVLNRVIDDTRKNTGLILNLALSYGSRSEIVTAARRITEKCLAGELAPENITEDLFAAHLYTGTLPDPDLIIRTGGESRLSNFLMWQASYAEILITEIRWPDFSSDDFLGAIIDFQNRQRRFGKTGEQAQS